MVGRGRWEWLHGSLVHKSLPGAAAACSSAQKPCPNPTGRVGRIDKPAGAPSVVACAHVPWGLVSHPPDASDEAELQRALALGPGPRPQGPCYSWVESGVAPAATYFASRACGPRLALWAVLIRQFRHFTWRPLDGRPRNLHRFRVGVLPRLLPRLYRHHQNRGSASVSLLP